MESTTTGKIFTGASGLVLPVPNKLSYPPEFQNKTRLTYYASLFSSIEINSSFYKVPMAATVRKWSESVPDGFQFTFKLWKEITHNKGLAFNPDDVALFLCRISEVGVKKGCLLVQFPPSLTISNAAQLEMLLSTIADADPEHEWKIALEFRNSSWYDVDIYDMAESHQSIVVVHDIAASATPLQADQPNDIYLRFHGPNGGYRGSYPDEFLYEYAQYIKEWRAEGKTIYAYFNNTMGDAVGNLMTLNTYLLD